MASDFIKKRVCRVEFGETLSVSTYQSIKPVLGDSVEYDPNALPEGVTEEQFRAEFKEKVRQEYFQLKEQMLRDFIGFAEQVQKIDVPVKR